MAQSGSPASDPRSQPQNTKHNTVIAPALYYFSASALAISLNINTGQSTFTASETCSVSVASGAAIKVKNSLPLAEQPNKYLTLGYNAQLGYRQFTFIGYNTVFGHPGNKYIASNIYVYIRLDASNNGSTGELIFLPYELDYDGRLMLEEGVSPIIYPDVTIVQRQETIGEETHTYWTLPNDNEDNDSKLKYYYIHIGTISEPVNGARSWLNAIQTGQLETAKGNDKKDDTLLEKMFRLSPSNIIQVLLPFDKLSFAASGDLFINRITNQHGADPDLTNNDFGTFTEWIYENTIATTRSIAAYVKSKIRALDQRYFRKDIPDTSPHEATFGDLHVAKNLPQSESEQAAVSNGNLVVDNNATIGGNENVQGTLTAVNSTALQGATVLGTEERIRAAAQAVDPVRESGGLRSAIYAAGSAGWGVDGFGNMEVESIRVRGYMEVNELRINRLQAQEGDTIFTDNDQIEAVEERYDVTHQQTMYILTLKEKWEGYFTAQQYGNICKGIINTLAECYLAKEQGRDPIVPPYIPNPDYIDEQTTPDVPKEIPNPEYEALPEDVGGNKYFTSWFYVLATHNTDATLGINQVRVALFDDNQVPSMKNFPPCVKMAFGRWGCLNYGEAIDYEHDDAATIQRKKAVLDSIKKRQSFFYISVSEGRFMKLTGVFKPMLEKYNYGTTLGSIPDFVKDYTIADQIYEDYDYLYAQGIIVNQLLTVGMDMKPVTVQVDCGDWVNGGENGSVMIDNVDYPLPIPTAELTKPDSIFIGHGIYFATDLNKRSGRYETHIVRHKNARWLCLQRQPSLEDGRYVYHEPHWNSIYWRMIDGDGSFGIAIESTKGLTFRIGYVDTNIVPTLYFGNTTIGDDEIGAEFWSWNRSLDTQEQRSQAAIDADNTWNLLHQHTKYLHLTNDDMPMDWSFAHRATFTVRVIIDDGTSQQIVSQQLIV